LALPVALLHIHRMHKKASTKDLVQSRHESLSQHHGAQVFYMPHCLHSLKSALEGHNWLCCACKPEQHAHLAADSTLPWLVPVQLQIH